MVMSGWSVATLGDDVTPCSVRGDAGVVVMPTIGCPRLLILRADRGRRRRRVGAVPHRGVVARGDPRPGRGSQHERPLPLVALSCEASTGTCASRWTSVLSVSVNPSVVEADLAAGRLRCPGCGGPLRAWGYARERSVRTLDGVRLFRPRRASCAPCDATHVLLPACSVPRRRDGADVIGAALLSKAHGEGHRRIAARLGRPPGTVRGWLRAFTARAGAIEHCARRWASSIDITNPPGRDAGSPLANAVDALGVAARACRARLRMSGTPWELSVVLTGGLLHGRTRVPDLEI
jgi:hypothetical protein